MTTKAHTANATLRHVAHATDFDDANAHIFANATHLNLAVNGTLSATGTFSAAGVTDTVSTFTMNDLATLAFMKVSM